MKWLLSFLIFASVPAVAQINVPELSPPAVTRHSVGYTQFEIRYGRPAARERKVMGGLVPFRKLWRTGAGECTTIAFDRPVMIDNKVIPAGIYALLTIPDENEWTVLLNSDTSRKYGDPSEYDIATEVVRLGASPKTTSRFYESLTIDLDIVKYDAVLYLSWETTQIHFPITTCSHEKALSEIKIALAESPLDAGLLAEASYYYTMTNEDPNQIIIWLDNAIALGGDRWVYHQKVDVLEKLKRYPQARQAAVAAIEFLKRTKPVEWEFEVRNLERKIEGWPGG